LLRDKNYSDHCRRKSAGSFFQAKGKGKANVLGITGTVQNLDDSSVRIIATGSQEQLEKLISWCRQGPSKAIVTGISAQELSLQSFDDFSIILH
jgi:acylphosphatase